MIRKLSFGFVLLTAFIVAACGRQVTPNPPGLGAGGAPSGYMVVKFDVNAPFNFANYQYIVVFNTSGNGVSPNAQPVTNNYSAFDFAIQVGGNGGATFARPIQFVKNSNPAIPPVVVPLGTTPQQFQYTPNSNGTGTEFTILFQRQIFRGINPSPSPSPTGSSSPPPFANNWLFNAYVAQPNAQGLPQFVDSMGQGGPTDTTWVSPVLSVNTQFDQVFYKVQDINPPGDPAAQIVSVEIGNNP